MTKLNKANVDKVIKAIRDEGKFFSMEAFVVDSELYFPKGHSYETIPLKIYDDDGELSSGCSSAACIGGWANFIRMNESGTNIDETYKLSDVRAAGNWLGLSLAPALELCQAHNRDPKVFPLLENITREHAIAVLEHLKSSGEVDWNLGCLSLEY